MGTARRERLRLANERLRLIHGGKRDEADKIIIPPAVKPPNLVLLTILVPKPMKEVVDELAAVFGPRFPSRNDLLLSLLESGLETARQGITAAIKQKEAEAANTLPSDKGDILV